MKPSSILLSGPGAAQILFRNIGRFDALLRVVSNPVDQLRHRIAHEFLHATILQDLLDFASILVFRVKPLFIEFGFEDQRHPVMNVFDRAAGVRGDDRAGFVGGRFSGCIPVLPYLPQTREGDRFTG